MSNILLIQAKDKLNTFCSNNNLKPPVHGHVWHFKKRIPKVLIGRVYFYGRNWPTDDRDCCIRLCNKIVQMLNDPEFLSQHIELLSANFFDFDSVIDLTDNDDIIVKFTHGSIASFTL